MATTKNSFKNISLLNLGLLTILTLLSGLVLSSTKVSGTSTTANAAVTVSSACTMTGTLNTPHTATVNPGVYQDSIGKTTFSVICNDPNGFAIYAIGYTGEEYSGTNHTKLVGPNSNTITTGTATSGSTSNWAMKLESNDPEFYNMTIMNGYDSYSAIPDTYTKVAQITSSTASATPATMSSTYAAFIASDQTAGTYNGKVKYTMVHPYDTNAPVPPIYMQNLPADICTTTPTTTVDIRDNEEYLVQRLADGNCWMLDNLRLDPTTISLSTLQNNTNASGQTLDYFKNGGGNTPYTAVGVNDSWSSASDNKFDEPKINTDSKNTIVTVYGIGSGKVGVYYNYCAASAGSYCYAFGSSTGNSTEDLCPAGWRLPTGGSEGEYVGLFSSYSSSQASFKEALSIQLSGLYTSDAPGGQGTYATLWTSTRADNNLMYRIRTDRTTFYPVKGDTSAGVPVRCLLK